uniref:Uncharacterized protein n=1 Tax=Vibrio sp. FF_291 TaxID=1652832 RepID=A0A0H3ZN48_9VIBR|nr:hypothetical protein [Vibrio sp. FF_291]
MIKHKLSALALGLSISFNVHAVMGVGDIVSDPVSYTYYAQELEQGVEMLKNAQEKLKAALETKDLAFKTVKNLEGSLRRAQRAVQEIQRFKDRIDRDPWAYAEKVIRDPDKAGSELERLYNRVDRSANPTRDSYDDWKKLIGEEDAPGIPNLPDTPHWVSTKQAKDRKLERELNNAIKRSVKADAMIELQLEDAQYLADLTNGALTQKDATDVGNAILLKMVQNQQQIIELLSSINLSVAYVAQSETKSNDGKALLNIQSLTSPEAKAKTTLGGSEKRSNSENIGLFGNKKLFTQ